MMPEQMRVGIGLPSKTDDWHFILARQMGCEEVVLATPAGLPGEERWEYEDLARLRARVESFDLKIGAIQNTPPGFINEARLGLPGRDRQIENYQATIRNVGRAGIPILSHNFRPEGARVNLRPRPDTRTPAYLRASVHGRGNVGKLRVFCEGNLAGRGGGRRTHRASSRRSARRSNRRRGPHFLELRRFRARPAARRRQSGLGAAVLRWLLDGDGRHRECPAGHPPLRLAQPGDRFNECFIGEGPLDVTAVVRALKEVGYHGFVIDDHAPMMVGDEDWHPRARCYQTGYMMGLLRAVSDLSKNVTG